MSLVGRLPRGLELRSALAFDIHQFYQSNRYAALISSEPRLASLNEFRILGPHNMGLVAAWTIDLMASGRVDRLQYGRCREVFLLGQRAGRILNVLVTYERELAEGDQTNDPIVGAARLTLEEHRGILMAEFEQLVAESRGCEDGRGRPGPASAWRIPDTQGARTYDELDVLTHSTISGRFSRPSYAIPRSFCIPR